MLLSLRDFHALQFQVDRSSVRLGLGEHFLKKIISLHSSSNCTIRNLIEPRTIYNLEVQHFRHQRRGERRRFRRYFQLGSQLLVVLLHLLDELAEFDDNQFPIRKAF